MKQKRIAVLLVSGVLASSIAWAVDDTQVPDWLNPNAPPSTPYSPPVVLETQPNLHLTAQDALSYLRTQDPESKDAAVLTYAQVEPLVRNQNLTVLSNRETLRAMQATDIDGAIADLEDAIDGLDTAITQMEKMSRQLEEAIKDAMMRRDQPTATIGTATLALVQGNISQLEAQREQLEEQITSLEETDYTQYERQFAAIEDQLVMGAQSAYIGLMTIQQNYISTLQQSDLTKVKLDEVKKRYALGQVSELMVAEVEQAKRSLDSTLETLSLTLRNTKEDLNLLLGREGNFLLDTLPQVTPAQLGTMQLARDLEQGRQRNYEIYAAKEKLEEARDSDADGRQNQIRAAEYGIAQAEQNFAQSFRKLFRNVAEKQRLLLVAQETQKYQARVVEAERVKYERGVASHNDYIAAQLEMTKADSDVKLAQIEVFSAYMQYQWAAQGILGGNV